MRKLLNMAVSKTQTHLFTYRHAGAEWLLEIEANDEKDAKERLSRLSSASYDGVLVAKVPAAIGPPAIVAAWVRNAARALLPRFGR